MGLVEDDGVVLEKVGVAADFVSSMPSVTSLIRVSDAVPVPEADLATHLAAPGDTELFGQAPRQRQRRHPARLGADDARVAAAPRFEADLGKLGGFPRPGLPGYDDDLVPRDRPENLLLARGDRQLIRVGNRGDEAEALGAQPPRGLDALAQPVELAGLASVRPPGRSAAQVLQAAADVHAVAEQAVIQGRLEVGNRVGVVRHRHGSDSQTAVRACFKHNACSTGGEKKRAGTSTRNPGATLPVLIHLNPWTE